MSVKVIGLTGYAQTGKTTAARLIERMYGATRLSFATPLKEIANELPVVSEALALMGLEGAKRLPVVRETYQKLGEGVREVLGEDTWVLYLADSLPDEGLVVIDDVRYSNEASICDYVVRVEREGYMPLNQHESEVGVDDLAADLYLSNDGDMDDLKENIDLLMLLIDGEAKVYV